MNDAGTLYYWDASPQLIAAPFLICWLGADATNGCTQDSGNLEMTRSGLGPVPGFSALLHGAEGVFSCKQRIPT